MQRPHRDIRVLRREALAPRLFAALFLVLGLVIIAAQVRAQSPGSLASAGHAPCCIEGSSK
ncbi:hypothetical protein DFK10_05165 [Salibaculum griseiflavum]|jgi:hypothetical protein|uniref:Uncharacterized protein n=1 Tax=Salibaculum griseiflavum TaxID=1914409 RepID=A0A2V1P558_9RHOB|nr:hypothetical protein DFK10_05165 [Salibaculum griseiflavum]